MSKYPFHYDRPMLAGDYSEVRIQKLCRDAVAKCFDAEVWAIPNAAKRSQWAASRAKLEGLKTGAPDLIIIGGRKNLGKIAFAEIKALTSLSKEQRATLEGLAHAGHQCGVFRTPETLVKALADWGWA